MTERLYYEDSYLTCFDAVVTEVQELSRSDGHSLWRVALDRSAFYPTGGGQPHDIGYLLATSRSGAELTAEIVGTEEDSHGEVWHHTAKPLSAGTPVRGVVNAERRLDHIQQHSGQHLLSAAFLRVCNAATVSFHLGEMVSTIDLAVDSLNQGNLRAVEELANRIIAEDRPVNVSTVSRSQAESWLAYGELRKLPAREGDIRIIEIAGETKPFDRNACGGTHVRSTGQVGGLHLRGMEKVRQGWRIEFVCGLRAMRVARTDFENLTEAGRQLSVGLVEVPSAIQRLQAEGKQAAKQLQALTLELVRHRAAQLIRDTPVQDGFRLIQLRLTSADVSDSSQAKLLASQLTVQGEKTAAIVAWHALPADELSAVIFARSQDLDFDCGTLLRKTLGDFGGRGGGSQEMAQGSVPTDRVTAVLDKLKIAALTITGPDASLLPSES